MRTLLLVVLVPFAARAGESQVACSERLFAEQQQCAAACAMGESACLQRCRAVLQQKLESECHAKPAKPAEAGDPVIMGALSRAEVQGVFTANDGQLRACKRTPGLAGRVVLKVVISPTGAVTSCNVAQTTVANAELEGCLLERVKGWTFPAPKRGIAVVTWPLVFTAGS